MESCTYDSELFGLHDPWGTTETEPSSPPNAWYYTIGLLVGFGLGLVTAVLVFKTSSHPIIIEQSVPIAQQPSLGIDG